MNSIGQLRERLVFLVFIFIALQLIERLYLFGSLLSPVFILVVPSIYLVLTIRKWQIDGGLARPQAGALLLCGLCSILSVVLILQSIILTDQVDQFGRSALGFAANTAFYGVSWALVGYVIAEGRFKGGTPLALFIVAFVLVLVVPNLGSGYLDVSGMRELTGIESFSHLWVSENAVILFFLAYASTKSLLVRVSILTSMAVVLVSLLGRSSLFLSVAAIAIFEVLYGQGGRRFLRLSFIVAVILLVGLVVFTFVGEDGDLAFDRVFLKGGLASDPSYILRTLALTVGVSKLGSHIFLGDPTVLVSEFGNVGLYIHNLLSAWQLYGFPFFTGISSVLIVSVLRMHRSAYIFENDAFLRFSALFLIYSVLSVLLTKYVGYWGLWFAFGIWLGVERRSWS